MPLMRQGDRFPCGYDVPGYSSLKKAGLLYRQWCMKCSHRCWIYVGEKVRWLEFRHRY